MKKTIALMLMALAVTPALAQTDSTETKPEPLFYPVRNAVCMMSEEVEHFDALNFAAVKSNVNSLVTAAKRKRKPVDEYNEVLRLCKKGEEGLKGTDQVVIVDSVVVDKHSFLSAYSLSEDLGKLSLARNFETVTYSTQINGMTFRPERIEDEDSVPHLQIVRHFIENGISTESAVVEGLGLDGDINYPFLMPDGQTFYFAARSEDGFGNYDLYVTRYDSDSKRFYKGENMGYPYNSSANDYMLVVDEDNQIGWFASDRYQPNGKVCIYTFIPNQSRHTIDFENTPIEDVVAKASLRSVASLYESYTDEDKALKASALARVAEISKAQHQKVNKDFELVINDSKTYTSLSQFTSPEAKKLCSEWLQKTLNQFALQKQLDELRESTANKDRSKTLNLENRLQELQAEIHALEKSIRKAELSK